VRSAWEILRRQLTRDRPYRCHGCRSRIWAADAGPGPGEYDVPVEQETIDDDGEAIAEHDQGLGR
jgi:hypothetical protein